MWNHELKYDLNNYQKSWISNLKDEMGKSIQEWTK